MYRNKAIFAALFMMLLIPACATKQTAEVAEFSGYLGNYDKLKQTKDELERDVLRWVSPELKQRRYTKIILDRIVIYPEPKATPQVSLEELEKIRSYANTALRREVSKTISVTNQPGEEVLRMRMAFTGVSTAAEGLKGYEYIPLATIVAGVATATGARDREAFIVVETELLDSNTGERLVMEVYKNKAKELLENTKTQLTADILREIIDTGAEQTRLFIDKHVK